MKKFITFFIGFILFSTLYGQADSVHLYTYGGIQNDVCNQIKTTNDGGYIMIGTTNSFGCGNTDFYAVKIDSLGRHEWSKTYGGTENQEGFSVTQTYDHGYAFVGFTDSYGAGGYDVFLIKTDSMGNFQWQQTYGGSDWDFGYSIQQLSDSGFVICGLTYSFGSGSGNMYVIRTDKNGDTLWTRAIGGDGYNVANSVCVKNDSLYAIVGNTTSFGVGDTNVYFILLNNKGIVEKATTYGSTHSNSGNSIRETHDHGFVIYGSTDSIQLGKPDEMIIQVDSIGQVEWLQVYNEPGVGIGNDAMQSSDGTYVSVGTNNSYGVGGYAMHIQHLQPGGWWLNGTSFGGTANAQGNSIAFGKNGNVLIAGTSNSPGYTEGLNDILVSYWRKDSIVNVYPFNVKNFYDTCLCTLGISSQPIFHPEVKIFPNPVSTSATLLIQGMMGENYLYNLYNETGECITQKMPLQSTIHGQSTAHFVKGNLPAGIYIFQILNHSGVIVATGKFILSE